MRATALLAVLVLAILTEAFAQDRPMPRSGVWFGLGASVGYLSGSFPAGDFEEHDDQHLGASFNIGLGSAITSRMRVAGELDALFVGDGALGTLALVGSAYPSVRSNVFLRAGVGYRQLAFWCGEHFAQDIALLVGLGYDLPRGDNFSLTPFAQVAVHLLEPWSWDGGELGTMIQAGLRVAWH